MPQVTSEHMQSPLKALAQAAVQSCCPTFIMYAI